MTRQIFTLIGTLLTVALFAQNPTTKVLLSKGQKIVVTTAVTITSSMGPGLETNLSSVNENLLEVKNIADKNSTISSTLTKLKLSMEMPGNTSSYDSEKKEDQNSEMGKGMSEKLNKVTDVTIDNANGIALPATKPEPKKDADEANPMQGMMNMLGESASDEAVVSGSFQLIPPGKKTGNTWSDSTIEKDLKVRRTYNFKSVADTGSVLQLTTAIESTGTMEMMGMSVEVNTTTTTTSDIVFDIATGLVKRKSTEANVTGNMQVMGQAMPISAKATTVSTYK